MYAESRRNPTCYRAFAQNDYLRTLAPRSDTVDCTPLRRAPRGARRKETCGNKLESPANRETIDTLVLQSTDCRQTINPHFWGMWIQKSEHGHAESLIHATRQQGQNVSQHIFLNKAQHIFSHHARHLRNRLVNTAETR